MSSVKTRFQFEWMRIIIHNNDPQRWAEENLNRNCERSRKVSVRTQILLCLLCRWILGPRRKNHQKRIRTIYFTKLKGEIAAMGRWRNGRLKHPIPVGLQNEVLSNCRFHLKGPIVRRRGKDNAIKIRIIFVGNPRIVFTIDTEDKQWFDNAIEKMEKKISIVSLSEEVFIELSIILFDFKFWTLMFADKRMAVSRIPPQVE